MNKEYTVFFLASHSLFVSNHFGADFNRSTYLAAFELFEEVYEKNVTVADSISAAAIAKQDAFIDACMSTAVMRELHAFVLQKGASVRL